LFLSEAPTYLNRESARKLRCGTWLISATLVEFNHSIGRVALSKDRLVLGKSRDLPTSAVDGRKECLGIEFDEFLGRCHEYRVIAGRPYSEAGDVVTRRIMPKAEYDNIADRVTAKK
jgi:hypothetical protein